MTFVGRGTDITYLQEVISGRRKRGGRLQIIGIEGPGGIGKTCLLDHVLNSVDLTDRNYLTLRIDGNASSADSLAQSISRTIDAARAEGLQRHPPGHFFPYVGKVIKTIEEIKSQAQAEIGKCLPGNQSALEAFNRLVDRAISAGKRINEVLPITKEYADAHELGASVEAVRKLLPSLAALAEETQAFWNILGLFDNGLTLRNAIRSDACRSLAEALVSDLSAILSGYQAKDTFKAAHLKITGADRLLMIFDDYEKLQGAFGTFLVKYLLPSLRAAKFESVIIILGRDMLAATDPSWDQHLAPCMHESISLRPLQRNELDQLVTAHGFHAPKEQERAWKDTRGYPFNVQLWVDEARNGGRSALMLKRFYDRTTRWMTEQQKGWLDHTLFLDEVNIRTLQGMLGTREEAKAASRWFQSEASIRDPEGRVFRVREYLRSRLSDYLQLSDPDRFEKLARRARLQAQAAD